VGLENLQAAAYGVAREVVVEHFIVDLFSLLFLMNSMHLKILLRIVLQTLLIMVVHILNGLCLKIMMGKLLKFIILLLFFLGFLSFLLFD
jgi:hypothetical protein